MKFLSLKTFSFTGNPLNKDAVIGKR